MADPAAERATSGELPAVPVYAVERARVPLVLKLFGLTALLIAAVVGLATAITISRARTVASATVDRSIAGATRLFDDLEAVYARLLARGGAPIGTGSRGGAAASRGVR